MPIAAADWRTATPSAMPIAPLTTKMSQIVPKPVAMSAGAGQTIAWLLTAAITALYEAPTTKSTAVRMAIQAVNTVIRPTQVVRRPGRWVKSVLRVPHEYSEPARIAPSTIAIAAPSGKPAPITLLTNWSG